MTREEDTAGDPGEPTEDPADGREDAQNDGQDDGTGDEAAAEPGEEQADGDDAGRIAALEAEVAELTERHARAVADLQNYRRRTEERWEERARSQLAETIARCLPPLDNLGLALASVDAELADHPWVDGVRMVRQNFREMLASAGVEEIGGEGEAFDPQVQEALTFGPGPEGAVVVLVREGYRIGDYVLRPAQVVVGSGEAAAEPGEGEGEEPDGEPGDAPSGER